MDSINLLPVAAVAGFRMRRLARRWTKGVLFFSVVSALVIFYGRSKASSWQQRTTEEQQASTAARMLHQHNLRLQNELAGLAHHETVQERLRSPFSPLVVLGMVNDIRSQLDGKVQLESLEYQDVSHQANSKNPAKGKVSLRFVTSGTSRSGRIMQLIRETGYFADVKLNSALQKLPTADGDLRFTVDCRF